MSATRERDGVALLARRLRHAGVLLLFGGVIAFAWAIAFTRGVDGLLEGLVVAVAAFGVPAAALLWIDWMLTSATQAELRAPVVEAAPSRRQRMLTSVQAYLIAIAAVALATLVRSWLAPYMNSTMLSPTFLLAVTVSAWVGGLGPAVLATVLSVGALWFGFLAPHSFDSGYIVGLALFATVALSIAGIASALRLTQDRTASLQGEIHARDAKLAECEERFHAMANASPAMLWMSDHEGRCTFFNSAWLDFTGRELGEELGSGWSDGVHPHDAQRVLAAFHDALRRREPFSLEYRLRGRDGSYRRVVDQGRPRFDSESGLIGYIGSCRLADEWTLLQQR